MDAGEAVGGACPTPATSPVALGMVVPYSVRHEAIAFHAHHYRGYTGDTTPPVDGAATIASWLERGWRNQMTDQIIVSVDSDVARLYRSVSDRDRRKLDLLVNLRLREATESPKSLRDIMREMSRDAQRRGLTPGSLQSILDEK